MQWFALRVKAKHEKQVSAMLQFKSLSAFTPLYQTCHKWVDRRKTLQLPLFPGYVFCEFCAAQKHLVLQTPGVVDVVGFGHAPAPLDRGEIEALQVLVQSGCNAEPLPALVAGTRALIVSGPLAGLQGIVTQHKGGLRLALSVTLLARSVLVEVDRTDVLGLPLGSVAPAAHGTEAWALRRGARHAS